MSQRNKAIQAMRKIANRQRGVLLEDALKPDDKELLISHGLARWDTGTDIDGQPAPYLMLTEAGMIAHEFALGEKKWKRKWEIVGEKLAAYREFMREHYYEVA